MLPEEIISEFRRLKTTSNDLKKFGMTMAVILGVLACFTVYKHSWSFPYLLVLALGFLLLGIIKPLFLKHIYLGWMTLAIAMGFVVTKVILGILFFGVFTITGVIARLFNKDMLDQQYEADARTYWKPHEKRQDPRKQLEHQF